MCSKLAYYSLVNETFPTDSRPRPRPWASGLKTKTETLTLRSRDQDRDLEPQVSRTRPRLWPSGLETKTEVLTIRYETNTKTLILWSRDQYRDIDHQISRLRHHYHKELQNLVQWAISLLLLLVHIIYFIWNYLHVIHAYLPTLWKTESATYYLPILLNINASCIFESNKLKILKIIQYFFYLQLNNKCFSACKQTMYLCQHCANVIYYQYGTCYFNLIQMPLTLRNKYLQIKLKKNSFNMFSLVIQGRLVRYVHRI